MKQKHILVICPHPEGVAPGQRLKYEQYFSYFRENGYEVDVKPFMSMRLWNIVYRKGFLFEKMIWTIWGYVKRIALIPFLPFYDTVYLFLNVTPFGFPLLERVYIWMNPNVIYDIDDLVFLGNTSKVNSMVTLLKRPEKYTFLMHHARHVIVCTPYLKEFALKYNSNVTDISSTINTQKYIPVNTYRNDQRLVLGWSGSHSTLKYFYLLTNILLEVKRKRDFEILIFGVDHCSIQGLDITVIPFSQEMEVPALQKIDIGLYPLPLDEQWVYGKSGLKALQYMALGIPAVATDIAANTRIIKNGETGVLVKTEVEWVNALIKLIDEPAFRKNIGQNGCQNVIENYSVQANKDTYLSILNRCSG